MNVTSLPSAWPDLLLYFFPIFTAPTAAIFLQLMTGWVLCPARHTVTGMLPCADPTGQRAHDAYHRFLSQAAWHMGDLWRLLAGRLIGRFYPVGMIRTDLDDTLFHHTGRKMAGAGWWRDAVRSTGQKVVHAWGLNLVVLTLRVQPFWGGEPLGLPINLRLHRKNGPSLIELAEAMLRELTEWFPQRQFLTAADGFYACLAGRGIPQTHLISRMRCDAAIYDLPRRKPKGRRGPQPKKGVRLPTPEQLARQVRRWTRVKTCERGKPKFRLVYARRVIWYHVSHQPVLLVISRDPAGKEPDDFFFTTDLRLTAATVIGGFAGRWSIEDTFKNTKQFLGGQEPQTWKHLGPERAAALSFWLYSLVWTWYLQQQQRRPIALPRRPWYLAKRRPSFQDALAALRRTLWPERIKSMFGKRTAHDEITRFLIEALASAA